MRPYFIHQSVYDDVFTSDKNYYRKTTKRLQFPKLTGEKDYDVIIVGGGLSGLATAYYLTQKHDLKTALFERHFIGWGASGRNGGQILPGYMAPATRMVRRFGFEKTRKLWEISVTGVNNILRLIDRHKIDCDLAPGAVTPIRPVHYHLPSIEKEMKLMERLGKPLELYDAVRTQEALSNTEDYYSAALVDKHNAWHFHPLKYANGLAKIIAENADIYEDTPVIGIDNSGGKVTVFTPEGRATASNVVLCGDSYLGQLVPKLRRKYVLIRNAMIATDKLPAKTNFMPENLCASEYGGDLLFYRKTADNRLMIGGGDAVQPNAHMITSEQKIIDVLKDSMKTIFPQIGDIGIPYVWGGYIGVTTSYLPYTGCIDGNIYYMGGYSGHGVNLTHAFGRIFAEAIVENRDTTDTALDLIRNMSLPGKGDFDVYLARLGMFLESVKQRFD